MSNMKSYVAGFMSRDVCNARSACKPRTVELNSFTEIFRANIESFSNALARLLRARITARFCNCAAEIARAQMALASHKMRRVVAS